MDVEREKLLAARAAVELVESGMILGLGTGTTVEVFLPLLARRRLDLRCVSSSPRTDRLARALGLRIEPFERIERLDLAIDGADQLTAEGWLNKGRGAAHTREKIVAAAADRLVVIADSRKRVPALNPPVPLELLGYGLAATLHRIARASVREVPPSPDGGIIADYRGTFEDPARLAAWLEAIPGVISHGLFPPGLATEALIGSESGVTRLAFRPRA